MGMTEGLPTQVGGYRRDLARPPQTSVNPLQDQLAVSQQGVAKGVSEHQFDLLSIFHRTVDLGLGFLGKALWVVTEQEILAAAERLLTLAA